MVFYIEITAVNKVSQEASQKDENQSRILLKKRICSVCKCNIFNWFTGFKSEIKTGAHYTGKDSDKNAFFKGEFLYCGSLFLISHLSALQSSGISDDRNPCNGQGDTDKSQNTSL